MEKKLGVIGFGNMGGAIIDAVVKLQALSVDEIAVYEVNPRAKQRVNEIGFYLANSIPELCRMSQMILIAVKPNRIASVFHDAGSAIDGKAVMSIAAGVTGARLKEYGGNYVVRTLRIMPNTPAMVGAGCMALCSDTDFLPEEQAEAERLMSSVGIVEWMPEYMFDAVTGLSGSGPAYVALFIEALADGGVKEGLSRDKAMNLAMQTVLGSAKLLQERGMHPGQLKDMVCSPGGTAIEGVETLEKGGLRPAVIEAVVSASQKSRRLI